MSAIDEARAALAEVERAITEADAANAQADAEFVRAPSTRTHAAAAVATQIAANEHAKLGPARAAVAAAEREEQTDELRAVIARAQPAALYERTAPAMDRIRALHTELESLVTEILVVCADQHDAVRGAGEIARKLGIAAPIPRPVPPTLLRAVIGIRIARDIYRSGAKYEIGLEPHSFVVPRPALPSGHPRVGEWRQARALALPASEFLPSPLYDFVTSLADGPEFFHHKVAARPQRYEV